MRIIEQSHVQVWSLISLAVLCCFAGCTFDSSLGDVRCSQDGQRSEGRVCQNGHWIAEADATVDARDTADVPIDVTPDTDTDTDTEVCPPDQVLCEGTCVDTRTSEDHCGRCGEACITYGAHTVALCSDGGCERTCEEGWQDIDGDWLQSNNPSASNGCEAECTPTDEICDGIDNDCDGETDEDVTTTYYLDADQDGFGVDDDFIEACAPDGQYTATQGGDCADGEYSINPDAAPSCNGLDDNCDGNLDEGCPCNGRQTAACYTGDPSTAGVGTCVKGTKTCDGAGAWGSCQGEITPESESCGDGQDNDCDGAIDDGCTCDFNNTDRGVCANSTRNDSGDCEQPSDYEATESSCDGLDNDCDDAVDEGCSCDFNGKSEGVCGGLTRDNNGVCQQPGNYQAQESACNDGLDNDCDGNADCEDSDCANQACGIGGATCRSGECREDTCDDQNDNDQDGQTDCADTVDCPLSTYCGSDQVCSDSGTCCMPESDADFCAGQCGSITGPDGNCGHERTLDCGGCAGDACTAHDECASGYCSQNQVCDLATCYNGTQDNGETGTDCGGPCALACNYEQCADHSDCKSGNCHPNSECRP